MRPITPLGVVDHLKRGILSVWVIEDMKMMTGASSHNHIHTWAQLWRLLSHLCHVLHVKCQCYLATCLKDKINLQNIFTVFLWIWKQAHFIDGEPTDERKSRSRGKRPAATLNRRMGVNMQTYDGNYSLGFMKLRQISIRLWIRGAKSKKESSKVL